MKYTWICVLSCCLFLNACKQESQTVEASSETASTEQPATPSTPTHVPASYIAPFIGMWAYDVAVSNDRAREADYKGRWIVFTGDGTFTSGKWSEKNNDGTFTYDPERQIITIRYDKKGDTTMDWQVKLGNGVMIWLGNTTLNTTADQIRLKKVTERPKAG